MLVNRQKFRNYFQTSGNRICRWQEAWNPSRWQCRAAAAQRQLGWLCADPSHQASFCQPTAGLHSSVVHASLSGKQTAETHGCQNRLITRFLTWSFNTKDTIFTFIELRLKHFAFPILKEHREIFYIEEQLKLFKSCKAKPHSASHETLCLFSLWKSHQEVSWLHCASHCCGEKMQGTRELLQLAEEYVTGDSTCVQIRNKGT